MNNKLVMVTAIVLLSAMTFAFGVMLTGQAQADTRYVKVGGAGDGISWANASGDLQDMIDAVEAAGGGTVCVSSGTYTPPNTAGGDRNQSFKIDSGVGIYGGFSNTGNPAMAERNWQLYKTILSGEIGDPGTRTDNCYHVIRGFNDDVTAVLDGFTITGGYADGTGSPRNLGGGMYNDGGSPTIRNCIFTDNSAEINGGGMYNRQSSPVLTDCTFSNNSSDTKGGGGMYNWELTPTLTNCTFSENSAYLDGGGISNSNSSPILNNCTFSDNSSDGNGGGINNKDSSTALTNCTFSGNSAGFGGGAKNSGGSPTFRNCTFSDNEASSDGGGMHNYETSPPLTNCTFSGNLSQNNGGGMFNSKSSPLLTNCIYSKNISNGRGGGIYNSQSSPVLINCSLSENRAFYQGDGLHNYNFSSPTLTNCILWGNSSIDVYNTADSSAAITYSDVKGGWPGTGNIDQDPMFVNSWFNDLHLQDGSPCINSGLNSAIQATGVTEDFEGDDRILNDTVDMGADEVLAWSCMDYDDDSSGTIEYNEMVAALMDYLTTPFTYSQMVDVLMCYLVG